MKKLWNENGMSILLVGLVLIYGIIMFFKYLDSKGKHSETMSDNNNTAYTTSGSSSGTQETGGVQPSEPQGQNSDFAPISGGNQPMSTCSATTDPSQLLPKDTNSQWSKTNPMGQGNLANVNLLKAGQHIGINTIGSSMKNPNLQLRSEPPVPRAPEGKIIWNQSTYEPDLTRLPFEINSCSQ